MSEHAHAGSTFVRSARSIALQYDLERTSYRGSTLTSATYVVMSAFAPLVTSATPATVALAFAVPMCTMKSLGKKLHTEAEISYDGITYQAVVSATIESAMLQPTAIPAPQYTSIGSML